MMTVCSLFRGGSLTGEIIFPRTSHSLSFVIPICTRAGYIWGFYEELPYKDSFAGEGNLYEMKKKGQREEEDRVNGKNVNDRPNIHTYQETRSLFC